MVFSSLIFVCVFLPVTLLVYYVTPDKVKNYVLLLASLIFYAFGGMRYLILLLMVAGIHYLLGILISRYTKFRKVFLAAGICFSVSILGYYKYMNFIIVNINGLLDRNIKPEEIILPIGISFYTFQSLSYLIDVYRYTDGKYFGNEALNGCQVQRNPFNLLLYISLFPQLIAGPIVRYRDVSNQIKVRTHSIEKCSGGLERFIYGLARKVIVADTMGSVADKIFALETVNLTTGIAWIGALCYTLQIYFDFSGYSDMAIGLAEVFGFHFLENFNYPYISKSITEFWRRWHISLSSWFRDYVYIPLGGNRGGNVYFNLFIVFLLTGIWHGAEWTFFLWGVWYGIFIVVERLIKNSRFAAIRVPSFLRWCYTMLVVIVGWVLFRADSVPAAASYIKRMAGIGRAEFSPFSWRYYLDNKTLFILIAAVVLSLIPMREEIEKLRQGCGVREVCVKGLSVALLIICFLTMVNNSYSPFIYFRF